MKASAVADAPPVISSMTPRSQVIKATNMEEIRIVVVKKTWRCKLKDSWEKKYCSMTSLQTNSSSGRVVNMLRPKQKRAILIIVSSAGKLLRILPRVLSVKTRNAEMASVMHATREMIVEMCVTLANLSSVGVRRLP